MPESLSPGDRPPPSSSASSASSAAGEANGANPVDTLIEAIVQVVTQVKKTMPCDQSELSRVQQLALFSLSRRSPRRLTSLARELGVELSVLSRQVAGLIDDGLAAREHDPDDGRAWLVRITGQGIAAAAEIRAGRRAHFASLFQTFQAEQIEAATAIVRAIAVNLEQANRLPTPKEHLP